MDGLARMPPVEQRAPGRWQVGTVKRVKRETPRVKSCRIDLPMWMPHLPGEIINIFGLAIRHQLRASDLSRMAYAYPTGASDISYML